MQSTRPSFRGGKWWVCVAGFYLCAIGVALAQSPAPTVPDNATPVVAAESPAVASPTVTPADRARVLYPLNGAQSPSAATTRGLTDQPGILGLATTFLMLLALCAAGYYLMRRQPGFAAITRGPRKLVVSESRSLGNRQFLVVVEYESERVLLGVTPGKIDYLCPLPMNATSAEAVSRARVP